MPAPATSTGKSAVGPKTGCEFPKILYVHDYPPESRTVADLIRQILLGYPEEKINWWSFRQAPLYERPDLHAAAEYSFCMPERLVPNRRLTGVKMAILETFWMPLAARHLERTIATVKPDLVVVLLSPFANGILQWVRWPAGQRWHVALWDMPGANVVKKMLGDARTQRLEVSAFQRVRQATTCDGCGPALVELIQARTGRTDAALVLSGFEPRHIETIENAPVEPVSDDLIRIAYVGTIISEASFLKIIAALKNIRLQLRKKLRLEFYGCRGYSARPWYDPEWMFDHPLFTDQGLVDSLRRSDWGIVVQDLEAEDKEYSTYVWPNKVGTCLSAGVPVLGFGHEQSCIARMMQLHRFGACTSSSDIPALEKFLVETFQMDDPKSLYRDDIIRCARTVFNAAEMRQRLWKLWGAKIP